MRYITHVACDTDKFKMPIKHMNVYEFKLLKEKGYYLIVA